jgi:hypothetical protein
MLSLFNPGVPPLVTELKCKLSSFRLQFDSRGTISNNAPRSSGPPAGVEAPPETLTYSIILSETGDDQPYAGDSKFLFFRMVKYYWRIWAKRASTLGRKASPGAARSR